MCVFLEKQCFINEFHHYTVYYISFPAKNMFRGVLTITMLCKISRFVIYIYKNVTPFVGRLLLKANLGK
jgi:hypothetical protein